MKISQKQLQEMIRKELRKKLAENKSKSSVKKLTKEDIKKLVVKEAKRQMKLHEQKEPDAGEEDLNSAKGYVRNAEQALDRAIEKGLGEDQDMAKEIKGQLSTMYGKLTGAE